MNDELQDLRDAGYRPVVVGPQPFSFEDLLRNVDPAPDEETERFVTAIYADRRQAAENSSFRDRPSSLASRGFSRLAALVPRPQIGRGRSYFSTRRLLTTERTPDTALARMFARSLLSKTP